MEISDLRDILQDKDKTQNFVAFSVAKIIEEYKVGWANQEKADYLLTVMETALTSFYPQAIDFVYKYSESEIEKLFVNSLIICFMFGDPLRLKFEPPKENGFEEIQKIREHLKFMLDVDKQYFEETGNTDGWFQYIKHLLDEGEISEDQYNFHFYGYTLTHKLGYYNALYVTLQASFPEIKIDGKSIRPDIFIWRPSDENFNLIIECDGFKFHSEKTSFISDRKRDRHLRSLSFDVLRFSGSEIYKDPVGMGKELYEYLQKLSAKSPKRT